MSNPSHLHFAHFEVRRQEDGAPWELGRGAMGVTYKAYDPQLRLDVALKVINPAQVGDDKARALFLREARAAARVHHANVGSVVFLNPDPENMFYAMEFIAGESLRDWLHSRVPLPPLMAIGLSLQIARGLEAIHREGVIHRDLKPTNLMVIRADKQRAEGDPEAWLIKIIDFGLARSMAGEVSETSAAANTTGFRGTALYASPEQCEERRDLDGRSDLYSLGCVMWEMLVGAPPFRANVHRELLNAHVAKPPPLQQLSHLPSSLQAVVARLLVKDREARFADAGALVRALESCREQVLRGESTPREEVQMSDQTVAVPTAPPEPGSKDLAPRDPPPGRSRKILLTAAGAMLLLFGGSVIWNSGWIGGPAPANDWQARWAAPVVAVLPFDAINGGKDETRLAEALTAEVINRMAQVPQTRVISRGAVMAYKTVPGGPARKRVRAIDAELGGVSAVLESSVDRQGDEVKINSVLYDANTEQRLWGQTYRRDWYDASEVEKEVPEQITRALRNRLSAAKRETPAQRAAGEPTAADIFFRALSMDPFSKNRKEQLELVTSKDPLFADAYAESAAFDINDAWTNSKLTPAERVERLKTVEELSRKALAIDPDSVPAHVFLSAMLREGKSSEEADRHDARAFELAPYDTRANVFAAFRAIAGGRPVEAYTYVRRGHATNPEAPRLLGLLYVWARSYGLPDLADRWLRKMSGLTNDVQTREVIAAQRLMDRGDFTGALDRLRQLPSNLVKDSFSVAEMTFTALTGSGSYETALEQLNKIPDAGENLDLKTIRMELLVRLGRLDEARQLAASLLPMQEAAIERVKKQEGGARMGILRLAKILEVLDRKSEVMAQVQLFEQLNSIPQIDVDLWVFRDHPEALVRIRNRLESEREKNALFAKRIIEIEKSYSEPPAADLPK